MAGPVAGGGVVGEGGGAHAEAASTGITPAHRNNPRRLTTVTSLIPLAFCQEDTFSLATIRDRKKLRVRARRVRIGGGAARPGWRQSASWTGCWGSRRRWMERSVRSSNVIRADARAGVDDDGVPRSCARARP